MQLSEQEIIRREKLNKLTEMGINAFPADEYTITDTTESIKQDFSESKQVKIAGRLMSRRIQGKASFAELQDSKGKIQVYFNRDEICPGEDKELYNEVYKHLLDIGDIIGIEGELFTTQVGEKTVLVKTLRFLLRLYVRLPQAKLMKTE
jgi:lysyl-tRNA synthetase class 2